MRHPRPRHLLTGSVAPEVKAEVDLEWKSRIDKKRDPNRFTATEQDRKPQREITKSIKRSDIGRPEDILDYAFQISAESLPERDEELDGLWAYTAADGLLRCILTTDIMVEHVYREWLRYEGLKRNFFVFFSNKYEGIRSPDLTFLIDRIDHHDAYFRRPSTVLGERDEDGIMRPVPNIPERDFYAAKAAVERCKGALSTLSSDQKVEAMAKLVASLSIQEQMNLKEKLASIAGSPSGIDGNNEDGNETADEDGDETDDETGDEDIDAVGPERNPPSAKIPPVVSASAATPKTSPPSSENLNPSTASAATPKRVPTSSLPPAAITSTTTAGKSGLGNNPHQTTSPSPLRGEPTHLSGSNSRQTSSAEPISEKAATPAVPQVNHKRQASTSPAKPASPSKDAAPAAKKNKTMAEVEAERKARREQNLEDQAKQYGIRKDQVNTYLEELEKGPENANYYLKYGFTKATAYDRYSTC